MIDYHETTRLWLNIEKFEKRGLTLGRMLAIVRSMTDPGRGTGHNLCAVMSSGQYELIIETWTATREAQQDIVRLIEHVFEEELKVEAELKGLGEAKPPVNYHCIKVTPTGEVGLHTGRRRYRVECATCHKTLHPGTIDVQQTIDFHEHDPGETYPGDRS